METKFKSLSDFKKKLISNQELQEEFKSNPLEAVKKLDISNPLNTDVWIYRLVVFFLGASILIIVIGVLVSSKITEDKNVPTILTAIGSAAIGALAGLLAPSPKETSNTQD